MNEALRLLLYPLGLLASLLFSARFFLQWISSERRKESYVPKAFWHISLAANVIMILHSLIQFQATMALVQTIAAFIAWRNLNLMQQRPQALKKVVTLLSLSLLGILLFFLLESQRTGLWNWMRSPFLARSAQPLSWGWHLLGLVGILLFASRFWIQWYQIERQKKSFLGRSFWWMSSIGGLLSLLFFIKLRDPVNILGYGLGLIPYMRNLLLIKRSGQKREVTKDSHFIFAGEKSGDLLGAHLVRALKSQRSHLHLYGVGGSEMRSQGFEALWRQEQFAVMGFSDVLWALPRLLLLFWSIKQRILKELPATVILIDYPDFNMRLARALRKKNYAGKIIHYVCPSIWAWRQGRIKSLARDLDLLLSILPFEAAYFTHTTLPVKYVGHPLMHIVDTHVYQDHWHAACHLPPEAPILALFPGSRTHEIRQNAPAQLAAAALFLKKYPHFTLALSRVGPESQSFMEALVAKSGLQLGKQVFIVPHHFRYELMQRAHVALATAGTVILELGLYQTPTVVCYKLSSLNYLLGKYLFRITLPYLSLVNLIRSKAIFPEFFQRHHNPALLAEELEKSAFAHYQEMRQECQLLRTSLVPQEESWHEFCAKEASSEAARAIIFIDNYSRITPKFDI